MEFDVGSRILDNYRFLFAIRDDNLGKEFEWWQRKSTENLRQTCADRVVNTSVISADMRENISFILILRFHNS